MVRFIGHVVWYYGLTNEGGIPNGTDERDRTEILPACRTCLRYTSRSAVIETGALADACHCYLPKKHSETKLKNGLIEHMKQFILELGKDFIFMDQEYRLNIGTSTFKADLLFFHRGLQALVAVELKKTKFHPRDLGQLEFYLEALDRDVKRSNENPSIGIILCPEADRVVVEYAMSRSMSPTMIAEYKRILIPQERMQQQLNEFCNLFLNKD